MVKPGNPEWSDFIRQRTRYYTFVDIVFWTVDWLKKEREIIIEKLPENKAQYSLNKVSRFRALQSQK